MHVKLDKLSCALGLDRDEGGYTMIAILGAIALITAAGRRRARRDQRRPRPGQARPRRQARLRGRPGRRSPTTPPPEQRQRLLDPVHRRARPERGQPGEGLQPPTSRDGPRARPTARSYAIELLPATGKSTCSTTDPVGTHARVERLQRRHLPDPLDRLLGRRRSSRSSPPSSRPPSSTTSTSRSSRPRIPSPTASRTRHRQLTGAYNQCTKFRRDGRETQSIPNTGGTVLRPDRLRQRRRHRRPAAHQRRPPDLRQPELRTLGRGRDRGERAPGRLVDGLRLLAANPNFLGPFATNAPGADARRRPTAPCRRSPARTTPTRARPRSP